VLQGGLPVRASPELFGGPAWREIISRGSPRRAGLFMDSVGTSLHLGHAKLRAALPRSILVSKQLRQPGSEKKCLCSFPVTCTRGWLAEADYALTVYLHAKRQTHWWWKIAIDDGKAPDDLME